MKPALEKAASKIRAHPRKFSTIHHSRDHSETTLQKRTKKPSHLAIAHDLGKLLNTVTGSTSYHVESWDIHRAYVTASTLHPGSYTSAPYTITYFDGTITIRVHNHQHVGEYSPEEVLAAYTKHLRRRTT